MRTLLWVVALVGCGAADPVPTAGVPHGDYRVASTLVSSDCPELGDPEPLPSGAVRFVPDADGVLVQSAHGHPASWRWSDADPGAGLALVRTASGVVEGCAVRAVATLVVSESWPTGFAAESRLVLHAAPGCLGPQATCTLLHQIRASR